MGCIGSLEEQDYAWDLLDNCGMICGAVACCLTCMTNGLCGSDLGNARVSGVEEASCVGGEWGGKERLEGLRIS